MQTVVIGSGMAGLTAAAYLARAGHRVTVLEQAAEIGGVTVTLRREGFGWDLGPLLLEGFEPSGPAGKVLAELGLAGRVRLQHQDRGLAMPDFALWKPAEYAGPYWRRDELKRLFPEESAGLDRYYRFYDQMMDLMALARRAEDARGLAALLLKLRMALAFAPLKPMVDWHAGRMMDHFFQRPELKALYTGILADFVVRPSQYLGLGLPAVNVENAFDRRIPAQLSSAGRRPIYQYILGGCGQLVEAVASALRAAGGEIRTGATVTRILVENGRVSGVELADGRREPAERVLASGGARETFFKLLGREQLPADYAAQVEQVPLMESVLMVHVGVDFDPGAYQPAALCYYYGTYDVEGAVLECQQGHFHEGRDGFLIYVPSMHSPELAPPGCHAVTVYTIAPNRMSEGSWAERRDELADKLLACAERVLPDLRRRSLLRVVMTPDDFRQRTHLEHHSFGGAAPVIGREGAPYRTPVGGLWFIGAQSAGRGGVAGVMGGARQVARRILAGE